ncbi:hypothetical protein EDD22DRAFT_855524, partial [Suillus occidentalis]
MALSANHASRRSTDVEPDEERNLMVYLDLLSRYIWVLASPFPQPRTCNMSESNSSSTSEPPHTRGRGRGKSRVLEGEQAVDLDPDSEEAKELQQKYARRHIGSNADRYQELEPELDSDGECSGEEIREPEVDLSSFLARQRLSDLSETTVVTVAQVDDDDIDHELAHISSHRVPPPTTQKGRIQAIEWDAELEEMSREKAAADASRGDFQLTDSSN